MKSRISVIMPAYNAENFIADSIRSVLNQSYKNFELIIVNDGSKDRTKDVINSFADSRIRHFYQENCGVSDARNKAIARANGEWLAFIDADDVWLRHRLSSQVPLFKSADFITGNGIFLGGPYDGRELFVDNQLKKFLEEPFSEMAKTTVAPLGATSVRKAFLDKPNDF